MSTISYQEYCQSASYAKLCGHNIAYWRSGGLKREQNLPSVLLIHGFPSAAWDWHHQWMHLSKRFQVVTLDMLGFGLSDKPHPHQYSLLEQADIICALLEKLDIENCHVLSHDYGDSVAQELLSRDVAQQLSFKIASMCFLNGGLFADYHRPLLMQKLLKSPIGPFLSRFVSKNSLQKGFNKIFSAKSPPSEETINVLWQLLEHKQGAKVLPALLTYINERKVHDKKWTDAMQSTDVPLYFINGVQDPISGQHMLDRFRELLPNSPTSPLDIGHYPQLEAPAEVLALYQQFLNNNEQS